MQRICHKIFATATVILLPLAAQATVKPNVLFSDGCVLQQGRSVPVWGTGNDGEMVTVQFEGQTVSTTVAAGRWRVTLHPLRAGGPFTMTISGENRVTVQNVLVGEVYICSGQSNMEWPLQGAAHGAEAIANSHDPQLRLFTVRKAISDTPLTEVEGNWQEAGPDSTPGFSAVGYYFGRDLRKALKVPIGLIHTSWGGTPAEAWTTRAALEDDPMLKPLLAHQGRDQNTPTMLYNAMIAPLQPYAIQGAIWYQGESNAGRAYEYRTLFPTMIRSWRQTWGEGDFPFFFVQLAPFMKIVSEPQESAWAELRDAQLFTLRTVPHTGMAVITDVGEENDIHPKKKEPVGARLALAALAVANGEHIEYSGPIYDSMKIERDRVVLRFKHTGSGLTAQGGALTGFAIAGEDHKFVNAEAEIRGNTVVVTSPQVLHPVAVRFGWADFPVVNLYNREGLPASPFRTDDFPMTTKPH